MSGADPSAFAETATMQEARRTMEVCNACRYCEGYCVVFPAMEMRRAFSAADLTHLANLCHSCRACYYACQYAPPHAFGINVPKVFAQLRQESYAAAAWPAPLAASFERNGLVIALAMSLGTGGVFLLALLLQGPMRLFDARSLAPGHGFYDVIPYGALVWGGSAAFLFALLALGIGFVRFWRASGGKTAQPPGPGALLQGLRDAATLRHLGGGGYGCNDTGESFANGRRRLHHLMAYGFLLCFAATVVGTIDDHLLGWPAPYPFVSLPVLLGTTGGLGMVAGTAGLLWLKLIGDPAPQPRGLLGGDAALLLLLLLIALSGLLLLALRATGAMGPVLAVHLGLVLAFFLTMPYGKFVHGLYRAGALVRDAAERSATSGRGG